MRGRLLLAVALSLLALLPPAQAYADLPAPDAGGWDSTTVDPCVSLKAALEDPLTALDIATHCTVKVTVTQTEGGAVITVDADPVRIVVSSVRENGTLVLTLAVAYAEQEHDFVIRCAKPGGFVPTWPVRTQDADCSLLNGPAWD